VSYLYHMKELEKKLGHAPSEAELHEEIAELKKRSRETKEKADEIKARLDTLLKEVEKFNNKEKRP
jgi:uncharacterized coiled-coil DUF342 family protein